MITFGGWSGGLRPSPAPDFFNMARQPRIRHSVARIQGDTSLTLAEARVLIQRANALLEDLHAKGIDLSLEIAGKRLPVKLRIEPAEEE